MHLDFLLARIFSSFGWVLLIAVFNFLALGRARGYERLRFGMLSLTAVFWVVLSVFDRANPDGPVDVLAYAIPLMGAKPFLIYSWVFYRDLSGNTRRQSLIRSDFLRAFVIGGALGVLLEYASLLVGAAWLNNMGAIIATVPIIVPGFMITVNPIMNVRRVALRTLFYVVVCFAAALVLYGGLNLYQYLGGGELLAPWYLYLLFWVQAGGTTFLAYLHTRFLKVTIQYLFLRDVYHLEQELQKFINEVQTLDSARESQEILQELILQNLFSVFRFERGFIVSVNRTGDLFLRYLGPPEERTEEFQQYRPFMRRRLPASFLEEMDQVFLLEDGIPLPFEQAPERYDRVAGRIRDTAAALRGDGYEIFMPLIFRGEIWGLIFLGPKSTPYHNGERILLNNARAGYAMALRNRAVLEEFKAASAVEPLTGAVLDERETPAVIPPPVAQRMKLGDRALVFADRGMQTLVARSRQIAAGYLPVLVQGETGTGKELVARLLHQEGPGAESPFVAVNCAAIPANLWESEIFGHTRGAFTGAAADSPGLVQQAAGGVIFFDEIGEMPLEIQPKILRLIQEKTFRAVGGKKNITASCRPVFATHRDLAAMSREGAFREDLYYRINVHRIQVPALRERRGDIPLIIEQFLEHYGSEPGMQREKGERREFSPGALEIMTRYDWPGNIRELENVLVRCLVEAPGAVIEAGDLPEEVRTGPRGEGRPGGPTLVSAGEQAGFEDLMQSYARELIERSLRESKGNQSKAARLLQISRGKLIYRMKELGIES